MKKLFVYLFMMLVILSCSPAEDEVIETDEKKYPDQESWNTEIILTKNGQKRAVVMAGHLTKNNNESTMV
ncbi:MAG: hypothetical protein JXR87_06240, partial [Candidatus Marinimicrobia bacterium]|nr:hypothetical protein [Candidatus Neomarinimicrobiota bacterium]